MTDLSVAQLCEEAARFSAEESVHPEPTLFGVTDGKAVGTYLELKFRSYLIDRAYSFEQGNAANGLDFPGLSIDMKVTSKKQPQSSCPFRSIRQKVYGLGYGLLVFVYDKSDDALSHTSTLKITDTVFVEAGCTADYQMTKGIREILLNDGNEDDIISFLISRHLTSDEIELRAISEAIMIQAPKQGYLTISPALQWRLQYKRVIEKAGVEAGVQTVYRSAS